MWRGSAVGMANATEIHGRGGHFARLKREGTSFSGRGSEERDVLVTPNNADCSVRRIDFSNMALFVIPER